MSGKPHTEVRIQVNAWVDEWIAPVVEALNGFPEVVTFDSCEGDGHVFFDVEGGADALVAFVRELAAGLAAELESCCGFRLNLEWMGSHPAQGAIYVAEGQNEAVAQALRAVSDRRTGSADGTVRTGTDRSTLRHAS